MGGKPKKKPKKPKRKPSAYNKHIGREMQAGRTMKQAAASWKKKGSKSKSRASPKKRSNPTGGTRTMAKGGFNMNKIYGAIRKVAIFIPAADIAMQPWSTADKITIGTRWYFGWDRTTHQFVWSELLKGWGPAIGAQVVTRVIPLVNRILRSFF